MKKKSSETNQDMSASAQRRNDDGMDQSDVHGGSKEALNHGICFAS